MGTAGNLIAGGTLAIFYEVFRFTQWVMSKTTFTFALAVVLFVLTYNYTHSDRQYRWLAWAAVVWMTITRPVGPLILFLWLVHDVVRSDAPRRVLVIASRRRAIAVFLITVAVWAYSSQCAGNSAIRTVWEQGVSTQVGQGA
ncbi:hypothetical protein [Natrinema salsiterrestre]|uniref:Uncharacterized protein n=1 Tax=Natrinema salsiterrestre TaxID=2950540 RepID=A0A9Q4L5V4_9EURY|nr:hypothetical protein [Natrinema salsiterrestre]MDF9745841.1 hypothetical protein [Natrinema salsiterrestre]